MAKNYPIFKKITTFVFLFFAVLLFKKSALKAQLLCLLFFVMFSFKANAQCTITGTTVDSRTFNPNPCAPAKLFGCSIIYLGDGVNPTTLVMYQNLNLTCLGTIQFIVRNNASIDFSNGNYDLELGANSSIIVENGGSISAGSNCSASDLIRIGGVKVASCNGGGGAITDFPSLVSGGGYNTVNAMATIVCDSGTSTITVIKNPTPTGATTYGLYNIAVGGTAIQTINTSIPYVANFTTPTLTSTTTFFIDATTSGITTPRRQVIVTVNPRPSAPTLGTITQPTCSLASGSVVLNGLPAAGTWTLTRTPGAITSTGTGATTTINGLTAGTYNYTVTNAAGCTSLVSANVVINAQPVINSWIGNGANANWNNPANWCIGVPNISNVNTLNVVVPSGFYPTINPSDVAEVVNIVIESGAILNIVDNYLKVTGDLTLNGKIDLNGESQLVQGSGSSLIGTGTIEIDQQGEGNRYRYNYWSMPVYTDTDVIMGKHTTILASLRDGTIPGSPTPITFSNLGYDGALTLPITLSTYWMYKYANSGNGYSAWDQVRSTGRVYSGQGFTMKGPGAPGSPVQNYVFVGTPNNGNVNLTVAANYDYLVGNPYPSAIDADQFILDNANSITGAIYFWEHYGGNTHNLSGYQGGYATYSYGGGAPAASFPGLGGGSSVKGAPKQFIPVGQAFFVVGDAIDGGQIQFNNGQRYFVKESDLDVNGDSISVFMKSNKVKSKTINTKLSDLRPKFRIGFDAPKISHRQLLLTIDERATPAEDWGFDAEIYEIFADDMYWMLNNKKYVIQAFNGAELNSEVPLGIQLSKTGMVTVKIDALENVDDDTAIYLKDKLTGETFNMMKKPVQLNLSAGKYADRFVLIFKTQKLMAEDVKAEVLIPASAQPIIEGIHVFMNNTLGELQIKNHSTDEIVSVTLINAAGQKVKTWNSNFNTRTIALPISTPTGVYVVQINTKNGKTVKKISVE